MYPYPPNSSSEIDVTLDDVVITTGSSGGFLLAFLAVLAARAIAVFLPIPLLRRFHQPVDASVVPRFAGLRKGFIAFTYRNYRLFWFGQLVSVTGTWMQSLAQSWLVYEILNASPFQLGLVNVLQFLPVLILGGFTSIPGAIVGGLIIGIGEKIGEFYWGPLVGGGIETWLAYIIALVFLMFRPQGLFGEKIIERI